MSIAAGLGPHVRPRASRNGAARRGAGVVVLPASREPGVPAAQAAERALRDGASSVVAPLWPPSPAAERRFVEAVRLALAEGRSCADAVRTGIETVRRGFSEARDWGAWCVFGSGGPLREVPS